MKICWDNLEGLYLTENGNFKFNTNKNSTYYVEKEECLQCGEPFLAVNDSAKKLFCSKACASKYNMKKRKILIDFNKSYGSWTVLRETDERRDGQVLYLCRCACGTERLVRSYLLSSGRSKSCGCAFSPSSVKQSKCFVGAKFNQLKLLKRLRRQHKTSVWLCECLICGSKFEAAAAAFLNDAIKSCGCTRWKTGVKGVALKDLDVALYDNFRGKFGNAEDIKYSILEEYNNLKLLNVRCSYCNKWFVPSSSVAHTRVRCLNSIGRCEGRFYCSDECKTACPIFGKVLWADGCRPDYYDGYCGNWGKKLKNKIKERDTFQCLNPMCSNINSVLTVHHINYDKTDCSEKNLITLCNSCNPAANHDREFHTAWYRAIMNKRYGYVYT